MFAVWPSTRIECLDRKSLRVGEVIALDLEFRFPRRKFPDDFIHRNRRRSKRRILRRRAGRSVLGRRCGCRLRLLIGRRFDGAIRWAHWPLLPGGKRKERAERRQSCQQNDSNLSSILCNALRWNVRHCLFSVRSSLCPLRRLWRKSFILQNWSIPRTQGLPFRNSSSARSSQETAIGHSSVTRKSSLHLSAECVLLVRVSKGGLIDSKLGIGRFPRHFHVRVTNVCKTMTDCLEESRRSCPRHRASLVVSPPSIGSSVAWLALDSLLTLTNYWFSRSPSNRP